MQSGCGQSGTYGRRGVGAIGERAAAARLQALGWTVLERNARTRFGELDLICSRGRTLAFVEVKSLRASGPGAASRALESIGPRKRLQVRRLARAWLADNRPRQRYESIRFDAIGVAVGPGGRIAGIEHVPAAF